MVAPTGSNWLQNKVYGRPIVPHLEAPSIYHSPANLDLFKMTSPEIYIYIYLFIFIYVHVLCIYINRYKYYIILYLHNIYIYVHINIIPYISIYIHIHIRLFPDISSRCPINSGRSTWGIHRFPRLLRNALLSLQRPCKFNPRSFGAGHGKNSMVDFPGNVQQMSEIHLKFPN